MDNVHVQKAHAEAATSLQLAAFSILLAACIVLTHTRMNNWQGLEMQAHLSAGQAGSSQQIG